MVRSRPLQRRERRAARRRPRGLDVLRRVIGEVLRERRRRAFAAELGAHDLAARVMGVAHVAQRPAAHPDQPVGAIPGEAAPQRGAALLGKTADLVEALLNQNERSRVALGSFNSLEHCAIRIQRRMAQA